ncbi:MAG: ABC transporter permease [Pikeienuella sp.]
MSPIIAKFRLAWVFALRELRGGLKGFRIFLACLALGVGAVAAVGSVRMAITEGLAQEGRAILGGDAEITTTYRRATVAELDWMRARAGALSEVADFRSMVVADGPEGPERALTQVKGVDGLYPLVGEILLEPAMPLAEALAVREGRPGVVMEPVLIERLGLALGDEVRLGTATFRLAAAIAREPDRASGGFAFGPRSMVGLAGLEASGLLAPGTLFEMRYRLTLPETADPAAVSAELAAAFPQAGLRWRDRRAAAPGVQRFVDRIGAFLVLVGLAALAVGGLGVSAAVRAYLDEKRDTIATLKTLGAVSGEVVTIYLMQIALLTGLGIAIGLAIGAGLPLLLGPLISERLPVPALFDVYLAPVAEATLYGVLTALLFALWPLARAREIRPAALFREIVTARAVRPAVGYLAAIGVTGGLLALAAVVLSGAPLLAAWMVGGVLAALVMLYLSARAVRGLAGWLAHTSLVRGRPGLRLALTAVAGPGGDTAGTVLSLGLGLTVLAAIGQVDHNLRGLVDDELPDRAPAFFFIDIQNAQLPAFLQILERIDGVESVETAPMLRGVVTQLNGVPAQRAEIDPEGAWILRGDRGVSYAATPPEGTELLAGDWWPAEHNGPPLVSFSAEHAAELRLEIGDTLSVNVMGREVTAEVASLRRVEFRDMGINFLMVFSPDVFRGAPHTHIATVYAQPQAEAALLREVGNGLANVTAIRVRDAIDRVSDGLGQIAAAARWAAAATLVTGAVVLIGAAAAGARRRAYEAAILKCVGAERTRILGSFALRSALTGLSAGIVAIVFGMVAGWGVVTEVFEAAYEVDWVSALGLVVGGASASLIAGLVFAGRELGTPPARILRARA